MTIQRFVLSELLLIKDSSTVGNKAELKVAYNVELRKKLRYFIPLIKFKTQVKLAYYETAIAKGKLLTFKPDIIIYR